MAKNGKKRRRKGQVTIPRDHYVYGHTLGNVKSLTVEMDPVTQQLSIREIDPSSIRRQITYVRQNKDDKVLYSAPADDFSMSLDHVAELKARFDYLMAVDTNTLDEIHQGYRVSACCIYVVKDHLSSLNAESPYGHHATFLILNADHQAKSEPIGWHLAITQSIHPLIRDERIGVIVDSELGMHLDINAGKEPYYTTSYLPPKMKFLYASSDSSATFANAMIRLCDAGAKAVLNEFERKGIVDVLRHKPIEVGTALCYRVVSSQPDGTPSETLL
ncbi:hypothetical protein J2X66_000553 [Pseudomonas sp. 3296]|uniref:hypothetical protein n=1 Tax=Pseudomonas sp. 3296 TaxID=2817753 RepID=UPI00285FE7A6|nr:hypothetical protein [Pseudomonas sp. 3296]MDR6913706.1 hypothetical protein [Pseudomonas sp. 3296]